MFVPVSTVHRLFPNVYCLSYARPVCTVYHMSTSMFAVYHLTIQVCIYRLPCLLSYFSLCGFRFKLQQTIPLRHSTPSEDVQENLVWRPRRNILRFENTVFENDFGYRCVIPRHYCCVATYIRLWFPGSVRIYSVKTVCIIRVQAMDRDIP